MAEFAERDGAWALVTGTSSGIGASLARALVARGLVVTAMGTFRSLVTAA